MKNAETARPQRPALPIPGTLPVDGTIVTQAYERYVGIINGQHTRQLPTSPLTTKPRPTRPHPVLTDKAIETRRLLRRPTVRKAHAIYQLLQMPREDLLKILHDTGGTPWDVKDLSNTEIAVSLASKLPAHTSLR